MKTSARHLRQRRHRCQAGFTLLETMVALALCGLIVAALGTATHLYWKYRVLSKGQVHTTHLVRGLTEDLSETLRSVAPLWESEHGKDSEIHAVRKPDFFEDGLVDDIALAGSQIASMSEPVPFVGMPQLFAVLTEHPSSRFETITPRQGVSARQQVVWWINDGSKYHIPLLFKGSSRESVEVSASDISKGLVRTTISANDGETAGSRIVRSQLISADVRGLSLRYFDGTTWTDDWSMRDAHEIPLLVEFTLSFADATTGVLKKSSSFVVAVPQGTHQ